MRISVKAIELGDHQRFAFPDLSQQLGALWPLLGHDFAGRPSSANW